MKKNRPSAIFGKGGVYIEGIDFVGGKAEVEYANEEGDVSTAPVPYKDLKHIIGKYLDLEGLTKMEEDIEEVEEETLYDSAKSGLLRPTMKRIKVKPGEIFGKGRQKLSAIDLADIGRYLSHKLDIYISDIRYPDGKVEIDYINEDEEEGISTFSVPYGNAKSLIAEYQEMRRLVNEITRLTSRNDFGDGLHTMPMKVMAELKERLLIHDSSALSYTRACADKIRPMRDREIYSSLEVADLVEIKARIENEIELVRWGRGSVVGPAAVIPKIIETDFDEFSDVGEETLYDPAVPAFDELQEMGEEILYDSAVPVIPHISGHATDFALEMMHHKAEELFQPISAESLVIDEINERNGTFVINAMEFIPSELLVPDALSGVESDELDRMLRTVGLNGILPDDSYIDTDALRLKIDKEEKDRLFVPQERGGL